MSKQPEASGREVSFPSGADSIRGFLSEAPTAEAPAIVVVPDVYGLSDLYQRLATRFAGEGVTALALDVYSREGAPRLAGPAEALAFIETMPDRRILGDVQAAIDWLVREHGSPAIGVTGFCIGGTYALLAACRCHDLSACVSFYGVLRYSKTTEVKPESPLDAIEDLSCPYFGIFGEEDAIVPLADVKELERRLPETGQPFTIRTYPGCGHAFLNDTRPAAWRPEAAADAFARAAAFFREQLGGRSGAPSGEG